MLSTLSAVVPWPLVAEVLVKTVVALVGALI